MNTFTPAACTAGDLLLIHSTPHNQLYCIIQNDPQTESVCGYPVEQPQTLSLHTPVFHLPQGILLLEHSAQTIPYKQILRKIGSLSDSDLQTLQHSLYLHSHPDAEPEYLDLLFHRPTETYGLYAKDSSDFPSNLQYDIYPVLPRTDAACSPKLKLDDEHALSRQQIQWPANECEVICALDFSLKKDLNRQLHGLQNIYNEYKITPLQQERLFEQAQKGTVLYCSINSTTLYNNPHFNFHEERPYIVLQKSKNTLYALACTTSSFYVRNKPYLPTQNLTPQLNKKTNYILLNQLVPIKKEQIIGAYGTVYPELWKQIEKKSRHLLKTLEPSSHESLQLHPGDLVKNGSTEYLVRYCNSTRSTCVQIEPRSESGHSHLMIPIDETRTLNMTRQFRFRSDELTYIRSLPEDQTRKILYHLQSIPASKPVSSHKQSEILKKMYMKYPPGTVFQARNKQSEFVYFFSYEHQPFGALIRLNGNNATRFTTISNLQFYIPRFSAGPKEMNELYEITTRHLEKRYHAYDKAIDYSMQVYRQQSGLEQSPELPHQSALAA